MITQQFAATVRLIPASLMMNMVNGWFAYVRLIRIMTPHVIAGCKAVEIVRDQNALAGASSVIARAKRSTIAGFAPLIVKNGYS